MGHRAGTAALLADRLARVGLAGPRGLRFANPDAVRPSSAGYAARRLLATIAVAALVVVTTAD